MAWFASLLDKGPAGYSGVLSFMYKLSVFLFETLSSLAPGMSLSAGKEKTEEAVDF